MNSNIVPRYPKYINKPVDDLELLEAARKIMKRNYGRSTLGAVTRDDFVLLITPPEPIQDMKVLEAFLTVYKENGIKAHQVDEMQIGIRSKLSLGGFTAADGWAEVNWRKEYTDKLHDSAKIRKSEANDITKLNEYLNAHPEYTTVFFGEGGRSQIASFLSKENKKKFRDTWMYYTTEDLISCYFQFPGELWEIIEHKTVENIANIQDVIVRDLQGTHVRFSVTEEEAGLWAEGALRTGHLVMYPLWARTVHYALGKCDEEIPICPKLNGVICGTGNHAGFYPHMKAHITDGMVTHIEGGGQFGEYLREMMWLTKEAQYPRYPRKGCFYMCEVALGSNPKAFRTNRGIWNGNEMFCNVSERNRSGVFHWGFGIQSASPDIIQWAKENDMPWQHGWHIHTYFNTYDAKLRDSGKWIRIIDNGRLTALDDPEVREVAKGFGDPDELLREDWVPAIPGINYPGDYMRDYGHNPVAWIYQEMNGELPKTFGVPD
jgi:hypothetical protein